MSPEQIHHRRPPRKVRDGGLANFTSNYDYDVDISDLEELKTWWKNFQKGHDYPLYGLILATHLDTEVALFAEKYIRDLDVISGKDCCFIYLRDLDRAKKLAPFDFQEQLERTLTLAHILDLWDQLPLILFFKQLGTGDYVHLSLANLSHQDIYMLVGQIFEHLRKKPESSPLAQLRNS